MKNIFLATMLLAFGINAFAARPMTSQLPHFDLDMTSTEYSQILQKNYTANVQEVDASQEDTVIQRWLDIGKRNLDWVQLINSQRAVGNKISFSSEATQNGSPVENPKIYNFQIIQDRWQVLETLLPKSLKKIVFGTDPLTALVPVTDRELIEWGLQIDNAYQIAARYKMMKPYQMQMAQYASYDVRGYLTLLAVKDLDYQLTNWVYLTNSVKERYTRALIMLCTNNEIAKSDCVTQLQAAITQNALVNFKNSFWQKAKDNYNSFFLITISRTDVTWPAKSDVLHIPFVDPQNAAVKEYLSSNIEDEYRWNNWSLKLDFEPYYSPDTTHIKFEAGATPHVNELAGSIITMDANAPLSEYDVQWTIRHEYGHVLGLPDCYFEFYDEEQEAYVAYQLDITNLMCSRRGHFKQEHFDQLKSVYNK